MRPGHRHLVTSIVLMAGLSAAPSSANVQINDPDLVPGQPADLTPAVGAIGNNVLIIWRVTGAAPTERLRASISGNGGATYTDVGWLPALPGTWRWGADPCVQSDPITNTFFVAAQVTNTTESKQGIAFVTAQVGPGIQWGTPSIVRETGYLNGLFYVDELEMNYDVTFNSLDLVFHDAITVPSTLTHQTSSNRGATWSTPTTLVSDPTNRKGVAPRVAWYGGPIVMSSDVDNWDQVTLRTHQSNGMGGFYPSDVVANFRVDGSTLPGTFDGNAANTMAVDRTFSRWGGLLYAAWLGSCWFPTPPVPSGATLAESEPNNTPALANPIPAGTGWITGTCSPASEYDCMSIALAQHQRLVMRLSSMVTAGIPNLTPAVQIEVIAVDGVHGLGLTTLPQPEMANAELLFTAPRASTYTLRIRGVNCVSYELSLAFSSIANPGLDQRDLYVARSQDIGNSWTFPHIVSGTIPGFAAANARMVVGNDGCPYLFWQDWSEGDADGSLMSVRVTRSTDGGASWEIPRTISSAQTDWQNITASTKIGWRIGAATTPMYLGEAKAATSAMTAALPGDRVHVAWTDGRMGQGDIWSASFMTGFSVAYRTTDTTCTPGEFLALRMALENHNSFFPQPVHVTPPTCQRNWTSSYADFFLNPSQSVSTFPYVIHVPDTAAVGTLFFQGGIDLGPASHGLNTFIHVQAPTTGVESGGAAQLSLAAPMPNPASTHTRFRFGLPAADDVALELFDVSGARVRTLAAGPLAAGPHARGWDLRDDYGRRVPAGVYLARFTVGRWAQTRRIAVIR